MFLKRFLKSTESLLQSSRIRWLTTDINRGDFHNRIKSVSSNERLAEYDLYNLDKQPVILVSKLRFDSQLKVDSFFQSKLLDKCDVSNIANIMWMSVKVAKSNGQDSFLKRHLPSIAIRLTAISNFEWSLMDISKVFRSLGYFPTESAGFSDTMNVMVTKVEEVVQKGGIPTQENIAALVLALQKSKYEEHSAEKLIVFATKLIKKCSFVIDGPEFCDILYGLQNMKCSNMRVKNLLKYLHRNALNNKNNIASVHLSKALLGIRNMNTNDKEIYDIIILLTRKLENTKLKFQPSEIIFMIKGINLKNHDNHVIIDLLDNIILKINKCEEIFNSSHVTTAIIDMKGMKLSSIKVRMLLSALTYKLKDCPDNFSINMIVNMISTLNDMKGNYPEIFCFMSLLAKKIRTCDEKIPFPIISNGMYNLKDYSSKNKEVRQYLSALASKIDIEEEASPSNTDGHYFSNAMIGFQSMRSTEKDVRDALTIMLNKKKKSSYVMTSLEIDNCMSGIRNMSSDDLEVRQLLVIFSDESIKIKENISSKDFSL